MNSEGVDYKSFVGGLTGIFDGLLLNASWPNVQAASPNNLQDLVVELHFYNTSLWNEEDLARRTLASDAEIAKNKRAIDKFNQHRNDNIEKIDEFLMSQRTIAEPQMTAIRSSETAGAMIDRISILTLKIHHTKIHTERLDADPVHLEISKNRLKILIIQRDDLVNSLMTLLRGMDEGTMYFKVYRQFKMYNDPAFNPALIAEKALKNPN